MTDTENHHRVAERLLGEGDYFSGPADASLEKYREVANWLESDGDSLPQPSPASDGATASTGEKSAGPRAWGFDVEALNREYALVTWGSKAVVTKERTDGPIEDRTRILSLEAFRAWFANEFTEVATPDGKVKAVSWAQAWLHHPDRRQYQGVEFYPNPDGAQATPGYLNLWRGFGVEASEAGTWDILRDHMLNNVCDGDPELFKWVFGWFAHMVQRPRERVGTALVLRGGMGVGKSKVGEIMGSLFPAHYFQVDDPRYITGQFNPHQAACLLLQAEEAMWAGDKAAEGRIKGLITSSKQMIEAKGIDPIRVQNYVRVLMTSNEDWVVPAGLGERRFCVLDVNPRCAQRHDYFREMDEELDAGGRERLLYDLLAFDLDKVNLRQIPRTRALLEQKQRTFEPLTLWWFNRLTEGAQTANAEEWFAAPECNALYADYLKFSETIGAGRRHDPSVFGRRLAKLVPGLTKTRPRREDGSRSQLYAFPPLADCREAFDIAVGQPCDWPAPPASESEAGENRDDSDEYVPF